MNITRFTTAALAGSLVLTLTGCGVAETAGQVSNAASTAAVCADALRIATANLDVTNPQAAADKAHASADELTGLAAKAANTSAAEAINNLATTMRETTVDDLVKTPAEWVKKKADQVTALTKACGG
ncbi:bacteriophage spanin2 family protein [Amycolatopsis sp.]|uniref:bacteriophage spanin2 family protein n=1 Tax=Amycolatopsis sp. TaxID=37632 RepID=UPI002D80A9B5|nr:bacteriophage spanin2 family protein [Amycolatopsis sp.]HET6704193.1 bacteriophage spanin2 family protein [Amycolatopsis sp.]